MIAKAIGMIYKALRELGLDNNTILVFTSDHGEEFGEHGDYDHSKPKLYDELIKVPLIAKAPFSINYKVAALFSLINLASMLQTILSVISEDE